MDLTVQQELSMTTQMTTKTLLAALAALTVASAVATTAAQAKDGCGRGMAFNGRQCVMRGATPGFAVFSRELATVAVVQRSISW
jgi:hypothetical protein